MKTFVEIIPDLKESFKTPDIKLLVQRYLKELNLPDDLYDYIDRLINFIPPVMKFKVTVPNYEARAVAYIVFVLKVIFGIDGYREIEISNSARKLNKKFKKQGVDSEVFVYEEWREYIAYRDILLSKYYFPYILSRQYQGDKPYESFLAMLDQLKPEVLKTKFKAAQNVSDQKRDEKIYNLKNLTNKLLSFHEANEMDTREVPLKYEFTFTPLHDAMSAIVQRLGKKLNKKIVNINHRNRTCEFFLKQSLLSEHFNFEMRFRKCTFPKTYFFKRDPNKYKKVKVRVNHDGVTEDNWRSELIAKDKEYSKTKISNMIKFHSGRIKKVLANRLEVRENIVRRKWQRKKRSDKEAHEKNFFDNILSDYDSDDEKELDNTDEIDDKHLDAFTAALKKLEGPQIFDYEKDRRVFTFITPDFNLWHRFINCERSKSKTTVSNSKIAELPKNFRWLLAAAANVINQEELEIYQQLIIIESEFIKHQKPVELLEGQPFSSSNKW